MTHLETARINELIGLQISAVQEEAQHLSAGSDLQTLDANVVALEQRIAALKASLAAIPHNRP